MAIAQPLVPTAQPRVQAQLRATPAPVTEVVPQQGTAQRLVPTIISGTQIPEDVVRVGVSDFVSKEQFNTLSVDDQAELMRLGVDKFNELKERQIEEFQTNSMLLSTGEYVDKEMYDSLPKDKQEYLWKFGVDKFNEEQKGEYEAFAKENVELSTGEYINRVEFEKLSSDDQDYLKQYGVEKYNQRQEQEYQEFLENYVQLDTGEYVGKEEFNSLSISDQNYLKEYGIDSFNQRQVGQRGISITTQLPSLTLTPELQDAWKQYVNPDDVGYGEGQLHPYQVAESLINQGVPDAVIYGYVSQNFEAERGATVSRWMSRFNEQLQDISELEDDEEVFKAYIQLGFIPEGSRFNPAVTEEDIREIQAASVERYIPPEEEPMLVALKPQPWTYTTPEQLETMREYVEERGEYVRQFMSQNAAKRELENYYAGKDTEGNDLYYIAQAIEAGKEDAIRVLFPSSVVDNVKSRMGEISPVQDRIVSIEIDQLADYMVRPPAVYIDQTLGYDIAAYLRDNIDNSDAAKAYLLERNFSEEAIVSAEEYNRTLAVIGSSDAATAFEQLDKYLEENEIYEVLRQPASADRDINNIRYYADPDGDGDYDFVSLGEIKYRYPELERLIQATKEIPEERISAPVSLEQYVSNYLAARGIEPVSTFEPGGEGSAYQKYMEAKDQATQEYERLYGRTAVTTSLATTAMSYIFPPARVMRPETTFRDISGMEWAIGGANVFLLVSPVVGTVVTKIGGGVGSAIIRGATTATLGGLAGYNIYHTVEDWSEMSPSERALAVGLDTLLLTATLISAGVKLPRRANINNTVREITDNPNVSKLFTQEQLTELSNAIKTSNTRAIVRITQSMKSTLQAAEGISPEARNAILGRLNTIEANASTIRSLIDRVRNMSKSAKETLSDVVTDENGYIRLHRTTLEKRLIMELDVAEQGNLKALLDKVSKQGMESLTRAEVQALDNLLAKGIGQYSDTLSMADMSEIIKILDAKNPINFDMALQEQIANKQVRSTSQLLDLPAEASEFKYLGLQEMRDLYVRLNADDAAFIREAGRINAQRAQLLDDVLKSVDESKLARESVDIAEGKEILQRYLKAQEEAEVAQITSAELAAAKAQELRELTQKLIDWHWQPYAEIARVNWAMKMRNKSPEEIVKSLRTLTEEEITARLEYLSYEKAMYVREAFEIKEDLAYKTEPYTEVERLAIIKNAVAQATQTNTSTAVQEAVETLTETATETQVRALAQTALQEKLAELAQEETMPSSLVQLQVLVLEQVLEETEVSEIVLPVEEIVTEEKPEVIPAEEELPEEKPPDEKPPEEKPPEEKPPIEEPPPEEPTDKRPPPPILPDGVPTEWKEKGIPPGTLEWRQGVKWVVSPYPYRDEDKLYLDSPLPGTYKFATGKGSAYRTLQVIGGSPPADVDLDMGWAQINISSKDGKLSMNFEGGEEAVNERWAMERERMEELEREAYYERPSQQVTQKIPRKKKPKSGLLRYNINEAGELEIDEEPIMVEPRRPVGRPPKKKIEDLSPIPERTYLGRRLRPVNLGVEL